MSKQFLFFYLMKKNVEKIGKVVTSHVDYWKGCNLAGYTGGPFADRSDGLILFETADREEATEIVERDPFIVHNLIEGCCG